MIFKDIPNFPNYMASDTGIVINKTTGKTLNGTLKRSGYIEIALLSEDGYSYLLLHRIIAKLFCEGYAEGKEVNHIDGDKTNNHAKNLEWVTHNENLHHAYQYGLRSNDVAAKKVRAIDIESGESMIFDSIYQAARFLKISQGNICLCCQGKRPSASGYIWEYVKGD